MTILPLNITLSLLRATRKVLFESDNPPPLPKLSWISCDGRFNIPIR